MEMSRRVKLAVLAVVVILLILMPVITRETYYLHILNIIGIEIVLAVGLWLMMSAGNISLGQYAFLGLGAYTSAVLVTKLGFNVWAGLPIAAVMCAVAATLLGLPSLRLRGVYFIMVTLGFGEISSLVYLKWRDLTNGAIGIRNIPPPNSIPLPGGKIEFGIGHDVSYYYLMLVIVIITVAVIYRLSASRVGITFRAIRDADGLAEHCGVTIIRYKLLAFVVATTFAGVAGWFVAHYNFYISPLGWGLHQSMLVILYTMIGGVGSIAGPVAGAAVLIFLSEAMRGFKEFVPMVYGALVIVIIMFLPGGLASVPGRVMSLVNRFRRSAPSQVPADKGAAT